MSDISNIIRNEIVSTLESLLSVSGSIVEAKSTDQSGFDDQQCIVVDSKFEFSGQSSVWKFFIPTITATKFEYLMLGGIADLKDSIDDEISDAVKEIISTISGSITTSVNAQGFDDIKGMKFSLNGSSVMGCKESSINGKLFKFIVKLNEEELPLFIMFDDTTAPFLNILGGGAQVATAPATTQAAQTSQAGSLLSSILAEESVENLRLLLDIKMRLSVRLGTKTCLLRDVISWDIGEIIELTQMTNEPLDILVNGVVIGQGEAVIVDGKFGIKIKNIGAPKIV